MSTPSTKDMIREHYSNLKSKHGFTCGLAEENLDEGYMMLFDFEKNDIVYDHKRIEENFQKGTEVGVYKGYDLSKLILFCLVHELGHYYDYKENKDAFNFTNKQEYIQMERNGIKKANRIIPQEMVRDFHIFNQHIIRSYMRDLED